MTTLRRELRMKLGEVCNKYLHDFSVPFVVAEKFIDDLADAALSLRGFQFKPQTIEQAIFAGVPVTEEIVQDEKIKTEAPRMFEKALGFSKPLPWGVGKEWTEFQAWICERYAENKFCFGEYNIWRNTPYTKGGMGNNRIRGFVNEFYDSWDMFTMGKQPKQDDQPKARKFERLNRD